MSDDTTRITPNPGYVSGLLSRALTTARSHEDAGTRARAEEKLRRFSAVLDGMLDGSLAIGSRTPVPAPAWATLEVVTGGFATGALLAGGPLLEHERSLLRSLGLPEGADARARLNAWHLGEDGLAALRDRLRDGRYRVDVPEEGALLVAAWLLSHDRRAEAHDLLDQIAPFFDRLRFYPAPQERALSGSAVVRLQPLSATVASLEAVKPSPQVARMNEALAVWSPYEDRLVALLRETFEGDAPCRRFPDGWAAKASAALDEYPRLRAAHPLCRRPDKPGETLAILRRTVSRCVADPSSLAERELRALGELLSSIARKRGAPGSTEHSALRATQSAVAALPTHDAFARVLVDRLAPFPLDGGIASLDAVDGPLSSAEAGRAGAFEGALPPVRFIAKLARSLEAPIEELVERGVIPSSEVLAAVAPQITSQVRAAGIDDPSLRLLYGAVYAAFRRRRSLLLLDLAHQVRLEELPWVRAIEGLRRAGSDATAASRVTLEQLSMLAITSYPEVILPNKLLQELSALAKGAGLDLPLVEELAADIFMGTFSPKFVRAAKRAASMLRGTLYERYYDVPTERVLSLKEVVTPKHGRPGATAPSPAFAALCTELAGTLPGAGWSVARNGTIVEQEQILTTHNLAVLFEAFALSERLGDRLPELARRCFTRICRQQSQRVTAWRSQLQRVKNHAYAWRQMVFFLSVAPPGSVEDFLLWAEEHLAEQGDELRARLTPVLRGLLAVAVGQAPTPEMPRFLGWSVGRHWLLPARS
ncbi:MAG: hypothetical protein KA978_05815 [Deltaproteobacteria bacterium]|nr:hypothetical protein [Deltaproteobacteria bacterium]